MQQRYYDPVIGRVLSRDAVTAYSSGDMRFFNGYAYAFNNPYKFNDPDGRCPSCAVRGAQLEFDLIFWLATRAGAATLGSWIGLKVYDITHHNEADEGDDKPRVTVSNRRSIQRTQMIGFLRMGGLKRLLARRQAVSIANGRIRKERSVVAGIERGAKAARSVARTGTTLMTIVAAMITSTRMTSLIRRTMEIVISQ